MDKDKISQLIKESEASDLGGASSYVERFKKLGDGDNTFKPDSFKEEIIPNKVVPAEWSDETSKDILIHYYKKFGNKTCSDFEVISGKIAASINRFYKKNFIPKDILDKLNAQVTLEDITVSLEEDQQQRVSIKEAKLPKPVIKINLKEGNYTYIKGLPKLTNEQLDLCEFIDPEYLCFSYDDSSFYLTVKPEKSDSFEKLFDFTDRENMIFQIFKEQLKDEHKAKKLVLLSRDIVAKDRSVPTPTPQPTEGRVIGAPFKKDDPTCRGSYLLGTACGKCSRCLEEQKIIKKAQKKKEKKEAII